MNRASHAIMGTNVRCGWGCLHRRGEDRRCTASFHSYSDPEVITSQLAAMQWTRRRVRVPKAFQTELGAARVVQYLCPEHSRHVAKLRDEWAQKRAAKAAATIDPTIRPSIGTAIGEKISDGNGNGNGDVYGAPAGAGA